MDWIKLRTYSEKRKARKNVHCASPVPGMVVPAIVSSRRNAPGQCLDLLSKHRRQPCAKSHIGNVSAKTLPAIRETSTVDYFSAEQSVEPNYNENSGKEVNENIIEMGSNTLQDSLHLNSGSRESLENSEASSGMTLPTGVSDFLLECLDSSIDTNIESSDGINSYSSPETFRDENDLEETCTSLKGYLGCKNSTLLDTSKANNIDKITPLLNFSKIFEKTSQGQDEHIPSDTLSKSKQCCESTNVSTTVAGKQVYKILSSKEKTPKSKLPEISALLPKQRTQLDEQQSRNMKHRKKVHFRSFPESTAASFYSVALSSPSHGIIAGELVSKEPSADMVNLSVQNVAANEIFSNTTNPNLEERASSENIVFQCLHHPPEICCIVKASPEFRSLKVVQTPLNRPILLPPTGVTTDIITSDRNWIYSDNR
ncbi:meiosis-specific kinetochore protein-like [Eublepharis macularius]|uniref:Meiosis-specific kinetochore protein-like n=1 Tax=Eublepharis macularius TaxID=481883 RepID=A0AA97LE95_EUBMA|nr:meiosis-specific kinetochore protein-like [Eublepharis macularius]